MSDIQRYGDNPRLYSGDPDASPYPIIELSDGSFVLYNTYMAKVSALEGALFQRDKKIEKLEARVKELEAAITEKDAEIKLLEASRYNIVKNHLGANYD